MSTSWHTPCLRGVIGDWVYYSTLMNAEQISSRVIIAKEIREAKALDDYLQRNLKPRVKKIASYLRKRNDRFFSSIILGVFGGLPDWVELDISDISKKLNISDQETIEESIGLLIFHGKEKMFAIDGQHRVEGIKIAANADTKRFAHDEYPVILVAHRDDVQGKVRTRRLFCDINKNAVSVSEGDKVVIDEDELSAIVTRRLYAEYAPFNGGAEIAVTEKKEQLSQDGKERFTSILAIHTVCKRLLKLFKKPHGTLDNDENNINSFKSIVSEFFDFIIECEPSLNNYFNDKGLRLKDARQNNRIIFFRPVGLEVLARVYLHFKMNDNLTIFRDGLKKIKFDNPDGIFDGVLWNSGKIEASSKAKKAGADLCLYLLNQFTHNEENALLVTLREITKRNDYVLPPKLSRLRRRA